VKVVERIALSGQRAKKKRIAPEILFYFQSIYFYPVSSTLFLIKLIGLFRVKRCGEVMPAGLHGQFLNLFVHR
jgi:hypothetical protein